MIHQPAPTFLPPTAPPIVGRDRERSTLRDVLVAALAGRGSLILLSGEAGIGKTTLAEALLTEAAEHGALVLVGRCYDLSETPPYGPWRELLERAPRDVELPILPLAVLPSEGTSDEVPSQEVIIARVRAYLAALAAHRPLVLLLEDLHWADPASLDLLRFLARGLAGMPLLVLATYRNEAARTGRLLDAVLPEIVREARAVRLDVRPLDTDAIGALVAARYALGDADRGRLVPYLAARTEGNALFLDELLRTLEHEGGLRREGDRWAVGDLTRVPVPAFLRQLIAGRVARLGDDAERLLTLAAVIGQEVPLALWAAVAGTDEEQLLDTVERALAARLLAEAPDGAGVRFAHALIREALYVGHSPIRRRALHRQAAEALLVAPRRDPDAVAYHLQQAGDPRAITWLVRAGLRAHRRRANLTAAERFAAAATLLAEDDARARERGWLLYLAAELLLFSDRARTFRYLDEIDVLGPLADDPALAAHAHQLRGAAHGNEGRFRAAVAAMERAVAALEALPAEYRWWFGAEVATTRIGTLLPEGEQIRLPAAGPNTLPGALRQRNVLANFYGFSGRYRDALALGEATVAAALTEEIFRSYVPGRSGICHAAAAFGRPDVARRESALNRADSYARNVPINVYYGLLNDLWSVVLPYQADDVAERARLAAEAAAAWDRAREAAVAALYPSQADLPLALLEGRWAEARRIAEEGLAGASGSGERHPAILALGTLARCQGDPDDAWTRVRALHPAGPDTAPGDCLFLHGLALQALAADLALDAGDLAVAQDWIAAHGRWLDWSGAVRGQAEHALLRARSARLAGDALAARAHAETALARSTEPRQPLALLASHRLLGELETAADRHEASRAHLDAALALADACAAPFERALTLLALAELRLATHDRDSACAVLADARTILIALEARLALARADALATRLAAPQAPLPPHALPFGLTTREAEVLRLVVVGLTNAQVAERLFVTPRTVNGHLTAVYTKLGVEGRAAAIRVALDHGLR